MKRPGYVWLLTILVVTAYILILVFVRLKNPEHLQYQAYQRWRAGYLMTKGKEQSFVNTSNNHQRPVALPEAQGYGLQIMAKAGAKGWATERDFRCLLNYYLPHRDYVGSRHDQPTYLMSWRQRYDDQGKWRDANSSASDGDLYIASTLHQAAGVWSKHAAYYQDLEQKIARDILKYEYNPST